MTGIIRFPRGSRPNKITKPPVPPTRRAANGGGNGSSNGASAPSTSQQLAIEGAINEQQQQQEQQQQAQYEAAVATEPEECGAEQITSESAQDLIQDGSFYNAPGQANGEQEVNAGVAHDQDGSNIKPDNAPDDSDMIDLNGGGNGDNAHTENIVTDMDEAEMSEMVSGAVESYTEENGIGVPRTAPAASQPLTSSHGLDMDLSAAAAAAAAAAAVASASHLATAGHNHHLHAETSDYSTSVPHEPSSEQQESVSGLNDNRIEPATPTESATAPEADPIKDDVASIPNTTATETARGVAPSTTEMAHDSGYNHLPVESALAKRLAREPGLRLAHQRRPDQQLNLGRRSNVEALFAHIAGEEVAVPCKNCHKGHGPWTACVVVDGQMCGSCANCWFNASGARCSFHETKAPMHGNPHRASLSGGISVLSPTSATSALDPQLMGSSLSGGGLAQHHAAHHFTAQPQHQHPNQNRQHALSSSLGISPSQSAAVTAPSSAAQQAAAAAAAAAVAVQQLSNGGPFPGLGTATTNRASSSGTGNEGFPGGTPNSSSPFSVDLITSLLGASRNGHGGGGSGSDTGGDAASADTIPLVGLVINRALAEVRNADQRGRDLILVEIAAKQLALAIVRYGEGATITAEALSVPGVASAGAPENPTSGQNRDGPAGVE
ncbi:hypothetical protein SEUCBS139899_005139 [Sporothrix eucalyptigena]|uniref:Uncharacterized protein n=1 Tax=Sporothrix eucalyptigena TaxID=1812306 RepID=A0ABP0ALQ2_9PEZI